METPEEREVRIHTHVQATITQLIRDVQQLVSIQFQPIHSNEELAELLTDMVIKLIYLLILTRGLTWLPSNHYFRE